MFSCCLLTFSADFIWLTILNFLHRKLHQFFLYGIMGYCIQKSLLLKSLQNYFLFLKFSFFPFKYFIWGFLVDIYLAHFSHFTLLVLQLVIKSEMGTETKRWQIWPGRKKKKKGIFAYFLLVLLTISQDSVLICCYVKNNRNKTK